MMPDHSHFHHTKLFEVGLVLEGVSDKDRVQFALKLMLDIKDDNAIAPLKSAARRMKDHANILNSAAFDRSCG